MGQRQNNARAPFKPLALRRAGTRVSNSRQRGIGCPSDRTTADKLRDHGRLLVRRAVNRDDWIADALMELAAESDGRTDWTPQEWDTFVSETFGNDMRIDEWLDFYA